MIYIISHGRPFNQCTYKTLRSSGYTGLITLVLDDEDSTRSEYEKVFSSDSNVSIVVFNKQNLISTTDTGVSKPHRHFAVFARNAVEQFANASDIKYFWVFDDDITAIRLRYINGQFLKSLKIKSHLDSIFNLLEAYMRTTDLCMLGLGTANNYIGGVSAVNKESAKFRMCYNAYLRNAEHSVCWRLNILEDRITSIEQNRLGNVCLQFLSIQVDTLPLGGIVDGGNSSTYRNTSKFYQSFFPLIIFPDCNHIQYAKSTIRLLFTETAICPKLISDKYRRIL